MNLQTIITTWVVEEQAEHPTMSAADVLKRSRDGNFRVNTNSTTRPPTVGPNLRDS